MNLMLCVFFVTTIILAGFILPVPSSAQPVPNTIDNATVTGGNSTSMGGNISGTGGNTTDFCSEAPTYPDCPK